MHVGPIGFMSLSLIFKVYRPHARKLKIRDREQANVAHSILIGEDEILAHSREHFMLKTALVKMFVLNL